MIAIVLLGLSVAQTTLQTNPTQVSNGKSANQLAMDAVGINPLKVFCACSGDLSLICDYLQLSGFFPSMASTICLAGTPETDLGQLMKLLPTTTRSLANQCIFDMRSALSGGALTRNCEAAYNAQTASAVPRFVTQCTSEITKSCGLTTTDLNTMVNVLYPNANVVTTSSPPPGSQDAAEMVMRSIRSCLANMVASKSSSMGGLCQQALLGQDGPPPRPANAFTTMCGADVAALCASNNVANAASVALATRCLLGQADSLSLNCRLELAAEGFVFSTAKPRTAQQAIPAADGSLESFLRPLASSSSSSSSSPASQPSLGGDSGGCAPLFRIRSGLNSTQCLTIRLGYVDARGVSVSSAVVVAKCEDNSNTQLFTLPPSTAGYYKLNTASDGSKQCITIGGEVSSRLTPCSEGDVWVLDHPSHSPFTRIKSGGDPTQNTCLLRTGLSVSTGTCTATSNSLWYVESVMLPAPPVRTAPSPSLPPTKK